jgi:hypothetical protein
VSFLRRLFGGAPADDEAASASAPAADVVVPEVDEAERDRDLLRADQARLNDELLQRQLRYADRSWTPPAQGGTRRSDDEGAPEGSGAPAVPGPPGRALR